MTDISACLSTGKDDWETPDDLFATYDKLVGGFVLDAAANESNHLCPEWLGPGGLVEDALSISWEPWLTKGAIWLNPPYRRGLQAKFVRKACAEGSAGVKSIYCLLPARTDTKLFHDTILPFGEVTFLRGRLKFTINGQPVRDKRGRPVGAPFPSMIVVF